MWTTEGRRKEPSRRRRWVLDHHLKRPPFVHSRLFLAHSVHASASIIFTRGSSNRDGEISRRLTSSDDLRGPISLSIRPEEEEEEAQEQTTRLRPWSRNQRNRRAAVRWRALFRWRKASVTHLLCPPGTRTRKGKFKSEGGMLSECARGNDGVGPTGSTNRRYGRHAARSKSGHTQVVGNHGHQRHVAEGWGMGVPSSKSGAPNFPSPDRLTDGRTDERPGDATATGGESGWSRVWGGWEGGWGRGHGDITGESEGRAREGGDRTDGRARPEVGGISRTRMEGGRRERIFVHFLATGGRVERVNVDLAMAESGARPSAPERKEARKEKTTRQQGWENRALVGPLYVCLCVRGRAGQRAEGRGQEGKGREGQGRGAEETRGEERRAERRTTEGEGGGEGRGRGQEGRGLGTRRRRREAAGGESRVHECVRGRRGGGASPRTAEQQRRRSRRRRKKQKQKSQQLLWRNPGV
ncbi:hypothetical protein MARPO_0035s0036 [Marchantia polymorpha]|uniref:Uncharacterized protein n=1 Tax=Marchantia polymorpha TaxID=3197 RepID=A0A2R6X565_MARPO|nr:hypothetical protein MARPO_0035s0036 [Marchantia polymorpha]|eukprot:PTQ41242.1 hypothetical protein MARPO_0035s0036 [Marchantia polymorpha]